MSYQQFPVLAFLLFLASCTREVELQIPDREQTLVMNCIAGVDSILKVQLTYDKYVFDTTEYTPVEDAVVEHFQ